MLQEETQPIVSQDLLFAQILHINCTNCPVQDSTENKDIMNERQAYALGNGPQIEVLTQRKITHPAETRAVNALIEKCKGYFADGRLFAKSITATHSCLWRCAENPNKKANL